MKLVIINMKMHAVCVVYTMVERYGRDSCLALAIAPLQERQNLLASAQNSVM